MLYASKWLKHAILSPPIIAFQCKPEGPAGLVNTSDHSPPGNQMCGSNECKTHSMLMTTALDFSALKCIIAPMSLLVVPHLIDKKLFVYMLLD